MRLEILWFGTTLGLQARAGKRVESPWRNFSTTDGVTRFARTGAIDRCWILLNWPASLKDFQVTPAEDTWILAENKTVLRTLAPLQAGRPKVVAWSATSVFIARYVDRNSGGPPLPSAHLLAQCDDLRGVAGAHGWLDAQ